MKNTDKLYELFLEEDNVTTKEINEAGYNKNDITSLIKDNIIDRVKRGIYRLKNVEEFYHYGVRSISEDYSKAIKVFNKCIESDPSYTASYFQLFLEKITLEEYNEAYSYLIKLKEGNHKYDKDHYMYLYLLSFLTKLSQEDIDFVKTLEIDDVYVQEDDKRFDNLDNQNNIRYYILNSFYPTALHYIYEDNKENNSGCPTNYAFMKLLKCIIKKEKETKTKIIELLEENDIVSVKNIIELESKNHRLSTHDDAVLEVCNDIIAMKENNELPEIVDYKSSYNDVYKYIYRKDYKKALELLEDTSKVLYMVLELAVKEIDRINNIELEKINYVTIANILLEGNYDLYFNNLEEFLTLRNKKQYKFIFADLIKISLLEKDELYVLPMEYLSKVQQDDFRFDIGMFLEKFYHQVNDNNFEVAKIYLDIIKKSKHLYKDTINTELLEKQLSNKMNQEKNNNKSVVEMKQTSPVKIVSKQQVETIKNITKEKDDKENALRHLKTKLESISPKTPFVLLNPMDDDIRNHVMKKIEESENVIGIDLEIDSKKRILLKYHEEVDEEIDFKQLCREAQKLNNDKNYNKCLNLYKDIICKSTMPKRFVVSNMGRLYLRFGKIDTAIMFFEISDALSKLKGKPLQHEEIIFNLKNQVPKEEQKTTKGINLNTEDFYDDMNDHYQIKEYEDIFALIQEGMSIENACSEFNLTEEDVSIIKLVTARNYYSQKNFKAGDKVFKQVERSKDKTPFIKSLMEEIRTNKKLYPYRNIQKVKK